jgi:hypothetical protein
MAIFNPFAPAQPTYQKFRRTYGISDFGITGNVTIAAASWTKLGSLTVPAQQMVTFGANDATSGGGSGAPVYMCLETASTYISGKIRLAITNANETNTIVVMEESTERLRASSTSDRTIAPLLPEYPVKAKQDSKLQVWAYVTAGATYVYNSTNASFQIPVTVYQ